MAAARTTNILAAGKSLQRVTPVARLQRKMATKRSVARLAKTSLPAGPPQRPPSTAAAYIPSLAFLPVRATSAGGDSCGGDGVKKKYIAGAPYESPTAAAASSATIETTAPFEVGNGGDECRSVWSGDDPDPQARSAVEGTYLNRDQSDGSTCQEDHLPSTIRVGRGDAPAATTKAKMSLTTATAPVNSATAIVAGTSTVAAATPPSSLQSGALRSPRPSSFPTRRNLGTVQQGPVSDVLEALLCSTLVTSGGERILAPTFPRISAQHELKYCGPVGPLQASAMAAAISARPGVLIHLNLGGKRLGDEGAVRLANALASIRSVDLRHNNIGNVGAGAIAAALRAAAAAPPRVDGNGEAKQRLCVVRNLSLAGNRIGDAGGNALSAVFEEDGVMGVGMLQALNLRWLSVAGNSCMSNQARRRLLRAGSSVAHNPPTVIV